MGMSASQARLIELTARMNDVEYEGQQINQQRQTLANKMNEIYNQAMTLEVPTAPSKIDFRTEAYSGKIGSQRVDIKMLEHGDWSAIKTTKAWSCYNTKGLIGTTPENYEAKDTVPFGSGDRITAAEIKVLAGIEDCTVDEFISLHCDTDSVAADGSAILTDENLSDKYKNEYKDSGLAVGGGAVEGMSFARAEYRNDSNFQTAFLGLKNYVEGTLKQVFKADDFAVIVTPGATATDPTEFKFVKKTDLETAQRDDSDGEVPVLGSELDTDAKVKMGVKEIRYDNNGHVEKAVLIDEEGNEQTIDIAVNSAAYDDIAYDAAMREYEAKKIAYDYEQNEFNKRTSIYQQQDKQLELKLTRLDNERNALNTEIEAVKKVIQDAIDKGFKTFSG